MRLSNSKSSERGYMLLILMFFVAMLTFAMMATLPRVAQEVKREREEEMIHRGTEYARAVKKFYKKFNRYPNSLQDLESTNNIRFLRRRYKDPMSKDGNWRLMHITDVQQGVANPNFGVSQAGNFNPTQGGAAGLGGTASANATGQGNPGFSFGGADTSQGNGGLAAGGAAGNGGSSLGDLSANTAGQTGTGTTTPANPATGGLPGQTQGAGGIVGVASVSKAKSIREFGQKANYNKWMFIYDPTQDKGTLLMGPYNPQAFQGGGTNGTAGTQGPGASNSGSVLGPNSGQQQQQQPNAPGANMPPDQNAPPQ
jgi:hypothetical protein